MLLGVLTQKEPICVEPGCNYFSLYNDINNDNALMLVGEWESQEALGHGSCWLS